jgi:hypothetical protein
MQLLIVFIPYLLIYSLLDMFRATSAHHQEFFSLLYYQKLHQFVTYFIELYRDARNQKHQICPFSFVGPYIFLNIFLSHVINIFSSAEPPAVRKGSVCPHSMWERISVSQSSGFTHVRPVVTASEPIVSTGGMEIQFGLCVDKLMVYFGKKIATFGHIE